ncbi:MAG: sulfotransferase [Candidatus Latescibacteria bacterium]|nr:sulfotransferase [bacterium]MBD3424868.1 sulfotransferase [Candidatus Latescibacterota bacterium]
MELQKPIFIVGTGRCGSTAFHRVLVRHPELAYLSALLEKYPDKLYLNRWLMRMLDIPGLSMAARRVLPSECWNFWQLHGIAGACRDLTAEDLTPARSKHLKALLGLLPAGRRKRLVVKLTGWPRIGYFRGIFPDAIFIHIIRDGRAVANSLLNVGWWQGWTGPENWGFGPLAGRYREQWEEHGRSFVALAGIEWKLLMDSFREASARLDSSEYLELRYEEICASPVESFRKAADFCGLSFPGSFEAEIRNQPAFENRNFKWRRQLTEEQQGILSRVLSSHLAEYGYMEE